MRMKHPGDRSRAGVSGMIFALAMIADLGAPSSANALSNFACTPDRPAAFADRVHVRCSTPAEGYIYYFAVCSADNSAFASRALSVFTTAVVTGKQVRVYYDVNDDSGTSCGCSSSDCRALTGVEVLP